MMMMMKTIEKVADNSQRRWLMDCRYFSINNILMKMSYARKDDEKFKAQYYLKLLNLCKYLFNLFK